MRINNIFFSFCVFQGRLERPLEELPASDHAPAAAGGIQRLRWWQRKRKWQGRKREQQWGGGEWRGGPKEEEKEEGKREEEEAREEEEEEEEERWVFRKWGRGIGKRGSPPTKRRKAQVRGKKIQCVQRKLEPGLDFGTVWPHLGCGLKYSMFHLLNMLWSEETQNANQARLSVDIFWCLCNKKLAVVCKALKQHMLHRDDPFIYIVKHFVMYWEVIRQ